MRVSASWSATSCATSRPPSRCVRTRCGAGSTRNGAGRLQRSPGQASRAGAAAIRLYLLAVGRLRRGPLHDLQALYAGRITPPVAIVELEEKRRLPPAALKDREAELILGALPAGARLVALDARGAAWTSRDFADRLASWRDSSSGGGTAALAFA